MYFIELETLRVRILSRYCKTQGDYVIISKDNIEKIEIEINRVRESYDDYNLVDLTSINKEVIFFTKSTSIFLTFDQEFAKIRFFPSKKLEISFFILTAKILNTSIMTLFEAYQLKLASNT